MVQDAERKRRLLVEWWTPFLPHAVRILERGEPLDKASALSRLGGMPGGCPEVLSVYVLFAGDGVPVYVGKAETPLVRWDQHLDGWTAGAGPYVGWRRDLLDAEGRLRENMTLLVVPGTTITRPPIPGFPTTVGSVEYQLVGLAADAFPGRLLNHEGRGRR